MTDAAKPRSVYGPASHYDRVTGAWTLLLGEELHYGLFRSGDEDLETATAALTREMIDAAALEPGLELLDVGCGTGAQGCRLAAEQRVRVTGITTSAVGVEAARRRAQVRGLEEVVVFEQRDGMDNGFADASFDRVWVLESSHLMRRRDRLLAESARVLRPGGRLVLCDIVLRRELDFQEVRRLREPLALLRDVFGDARMEPLARYVDLATAVGLAVERQVDLTAVTRPTFDRWHANALRHRDEVTGAVGEAGWQEFVHACDLLGGFWDDGTLGYGLFVADKP